MKKFLIAALVATSMFAIATDAAAAVVVNFAFNGNTGNTPGNVTGRLVFNTTGTNVGASEVYIFSAPAGTIDANALNKNLFAASDAVRFNAFDVSSAGIVSAAKLSFTSRNTYNTEVELNNSNNGNASYVYNYTTNLFTLSQGGFAAITFTPVNATAAVPEPAAWAMMMLGFGGIGFALRRRSKVTTRVRFA